MPDKNNRLVRFADLNVLGKAIYVTGAAVRGATKVIDGAIHRAADIWLEAEEAFKKERDPNLLDAKILDEIEDRPGRGAGEPPA